MKINSSFVTDFSVTAYMRDLKAQVDQINITRTLRSHAKINMQMVQKYFPREWIFSVYTRSCSTASNQYYFNAACIFLYIAFNLHYQTGTAMRQYINYYSFILNNYSNQDEVFYQAATSACPEYFSFVLSEVWFLNSVTVLHGHILGL